MFLPSPSGGVEIKMGSAQDALGALVLLRSSVVCHVLESFNLRMVRMLMVRVRERKKVEKRGLPVPPTLLPGIAPHTLLLLFLFGKNSVEAEQPINSPRAP